MDFILQSQTHENFMATQQGYNGTIPETDGHSQSMSSGSSQDVLYEYLPTTLLKPLSFPRLLTPTPSVPNSLLYTGQTDRASFSTNATENANMAADFASETFLNTQESCPQYLNYSQAPSSSSQGENPGEESRQVDEPHKSTVNNNNTKDALADDKRYRRLMRNREAAKKNRSKKKEWIEGLQIRTSCLTEDNKGLLKKSEVLQNELNWLRSLLIRKGYSELSIPNV
jgi:hypothetical protein